MLEAPSRPTRARPGSLLPALAAGALLLGTGCSTVRSAVLLPIEVADRSLDLAGKSLGLAAQGLELAARGGKLAYDQVNARMRTAETAVRVAGEAAKVVRDARRSGAPAPRDRQARALPSAVWPTCSTDQNR